MKGVLLVSRVIWASELTPTTFTDPRDGTTHAGKYQLQLVLYNAGEKLPAKSRGGQPIKMTMPAAALLKRAANRPYEVAPPDTMPIGPVAIPVAAFAGLPLTSNVQVRWRFVPEAD
jgi:hypothetical protein